MKDYTNYRSYTNIDMVDFSGKFHFKEQLKQEGTNIKINEKSTQLINNIDTIIRAIVRNTGVENKEEDEERSIMIGKEYTYKCGDYVEYLDDIYITNTSVDKDNPFFNTAKMKRCNHLFKWMDNGKLYQAWGVVESVSNVDIGVENVDNSFREGDYQYSIKFGYNDVTKNIKVGQRFIFNENAWEVTRINSVTNNGLLLITADENSINELDDMTNEIANAFEHSYVISLNSTSQTIQEGETYQIVPTIRDNGTEVSDATITYTSSDETISTVDDNGLVKGLKTGSCTIAISVGDTNTTMTLNVAAKTSSIITNYECTWTRGTTLRLYSATTLECKKYVNSVEQSGLVIDYTIDDSASQTLINNEHVIVNKLKDNQIQIRNVGQTTEAEFKINIVDSADKTLILSQQIIKLTGMEG